MLFFPFIFYVMMKCRKGERRKKAVGVYAKCISLVSMVPTDTHPSPLTSTHTLPLRAYRTLCAPSIYRIEPYTLDRRVLHNLWRSSHCVGWETETRTTTPTRLKCMCHSSRSYGERDTTSAQIAVRSTQGTSLNNCPSILSCLVLSCGTLYFVLCCEYFVWRGQVI